TVVVDRERAIGRVPRIITERSSREVGGGESAGDRLVVRSRIPLILNYTCIVGRAVGLEHIEKDGGDVAGRRAVAEMVAETVPARETLLGNVFERSIIIQCKIGR